MLALQFSFKQQHANLPMCGVNTYIDILGNSSLRILNNCDNLSQNCIVLRLVYCNNFVCHTFATKQTY